MSLAALDAWTVAAAREGLQRGEGPFWDASQLCGRPLFGVGGQPWSSPMAPLVLETGRWPLFGLAVVGMFLLWDKGPRRPWTLVAALAALACAVTMPLGFVLGLGLAPWALLGFWRAPRSAAVALLALFLSALSPLLSVAVLVLSYMERRLPSEWARRVGWALLFIAPAWLPLFFHDNAVLERGRIWSLVAPSEWMAALAWSCSAALLRGSERPGRLAVVGAMALAAMLAFSIQGAPAPRAGRSESALRYNQALSRYLDAEGGVQSLAMGSAGLLPQAQVVGSLDGRGSAAALRRWQRLAASGIREADLLSLGNVGWFAGMDDGKGGRWTQPVLAALVDGAILDGYQAERWAGLSLFQRPLKVSGLTVTEARGSAWRLLTPEKMENGLVQIPLPAGQGGWIFFSQSYDAGWRAWVKDPQGYWKERPIAKTEGGFMAAPIESGGQAVLFQFRPPLLAFGLVLSLLALGFFAWKDRAFLFQAR